MFDFQRSTWHTSLLLAKQNSGDLACLTAPQLIRRTQQTGSQYTILNKYLTKFLNSRTDQECPKEACGAEHSRGMNCRPFQRSAKCSGAITRITSLCRDQTGVVMDHFVLKKQLMHNSSRGAHANREQTHFYSSAFLRGQPVFTVRNHAERFGTRAKTTRSPAPQFHSPDSSPQMSI